MIRLDKYLATLNVGSRSQVKDLIKKGQISLNGKVCKNPEQKVSEYCDEVLVMGKKLTYEPYQYYMLNKPGGVVSATKDNRDTTVLALVREASGTNLFPVGRLDKDTEGLLLITNDGELAHRLLSPRKHIYKTYYVETKLPFTNEMRIRLEEGVDIKDEKPTLPAVVNMLAEHCIELSITEGRFHQIKRMLEAVGNKVVYLKRISMGTLVLDDALFPGEYRKLTESELKSLKTNV